MEDLTPTSQRRRNGPGRRASDHHNAVQAALTEHFKRIAWRALWAWAILATVAAIAAAIELIQSREALNHSDVATSKATAAANKANKALSRANIALAAQHEALIDGCIRLNIQDARDNKSHYADYGVFKFVQKRFTVPTPTETAKQRRITAAFAGRLLFAVSAKTWVPLTDCAAAVAQVGSAYRPAEPIPFSVRLPPASALDSSNASLVDPEGSVP